MNTFALYVIKHIKSTLSILNEDDFTLIVKTLFIFLSLSVNTLSYA